MFGIIFERVATYLNFVYCQIATNQANLISPISSNTHLFIYFIVYDTYKVVSLQLHVTLSTQILVLAAQDAHPSSRNTNLFLKALTFASTLTF